MEASELNHDIVTTAIAFANSDGELSECLFDWTGSYRLVSDSEAWTIAVDRGSFTLAEVGDDIASFAMAGPQLVWDRILAAVPRPGYTDFPDASRTDPTFTLEPRPATGNAQNALRRFVELLRHAANSSDPKPIGPARESASLPRHANRVGRYLYLELDGTEQCLYYEEAGSGIPLLCQHTAGSDGRQWRHLLEDERVTSKYRVIAYDLPIHGKSLPPADRAWWAEEYLLTTKKAMEVPVELSRALGLDTPVFIGSSVGGMLALDLARYHPTDFRAVISLEGGLTVPNHDEPVHRLQTGRYFDSALYAAQMFGVMGAPAPEAGKQETMLHYAQGAPGIFWGDSNYYLADHDLTGEADKIDTSVCPVYLLTGEYDHFTVPMTEEAAKAIAGSTMTIMEGIGHFPMSEDYVQLSTYVLPILEEIAAK